MALKKTIDTEIKNRNTGDYLANERTFLAWIRTCIAIMAFGFVVEKFSIFLQQIARFISKGSNTLMPMAAPSHDSYFFGLLLVILGGVMCILAFIKFRITEKQIEQETYAPSLILDLMLTLIIVLIGLFLVIYLIHSVFK